MIHLHKVTKVYKNGVKALSDINLRVRKGEFIFLVGASGAGKSTMIKLIHREEQPSQGHVMFAGKNIVRLRQREIPLLRRKIGMVFQDFRLLPQKTAAENVSFALEVTGTPRNAIKRMVPAALEKVAMLDKAQRYPHQLSGGEQQRVGIARAIVNNPILIMADEPTGNLDRETSQDIMELFNDINRGGTTIMMSTHAWDIVDSMQKRVVALKDGIVARDDEIGVYDIEN